MRQPWPAHRTPGRSWLRVVAALAATQNRPRTPPTPATPTRRIPWRMVAAVAGAGLLGVWLFRPTRPPGPWLAANRARSRRLEELEDRYVQADLIDRSRSYDRIEPPEGHWGSPTASRPDGARTLASARPADYREDPDDSTADDPEAG